MMQPDDPPFLTVGTEVSAKYKGAFCEAKVHKVVKIVKIKVTFKQGLGSAVLSDEDLKGSLKVGSQVKALHPEKNQHFDAIINKIQDCSQYTVVFDDGDITTLRRSSLCLKSGRHFAESETLDQLPLTHPEHFGTPVVGGRRGRRSRPNQDSDASSEDEENVYKRHRSQREEWQNDIGKVICVEIGDKKKQKDNWFPGLVVAPTAQDTVKIETKKDFLVRSFQDGRYYTVPKKEATNFNREIGQKVSQSALRTAVDKALLYIDREELPPHWDRDLLFGVDLSDEDSDKDTETDSSDDEPREEKDHFVAQLYKYMEECGAPINKGPTIGNKELDLYKLFKVVHKFGGFNRVMNQNQWKAVANKMNLQLGSQAGTLAKSAYKRYLQSFEEFYRKLGCTMVSNPRGSRMRHRSGRSLIRDCDRTPRHKKDTESCESTEEELDKKDDSEEGKEELFKEHYIPISCVSEPKKEPQFQLRKCGTPLSLRALSPSGKEKPVLNRDSKICKSDSKIIKTVPKEEEIKTRSSTALLHSAKEPEGGEDDDNLRSTSEEETESITTRSLRNREDPKEKEDSLSGAKITALRHRTVQENHQRSTSCNSTSSGTSSSSSSNGATSSSSSGSSTTESKSSDKGTRSLSLDDKKRGRKKKLEAEFEQPAGRSILPAHVPVNIGDKLRVLYGPTNKESKVTYEAKVLEIDEEDGQKLYYVHYNGWNIRYDEWVLRQRIAQNLTWCQARSKKGRAAATKELKEREKKEPPKSDKPQEKEKESTSTTASRISGSATKRSRLSSLSERERKDVDKSESPISRSLTRSSSRNESRDEKSGSNDATFDRRRSSRRNLDLSKDLEDSFSEDFDSGAESNNEDQKSKATPPPSDSPSLPSKTLKGNSEYIIKDDLKLPEEKPIKMESAKSNLPVAISASCGKDIDMKAIESEMKGLDKPIKKEDALTLKEIPGRLLTTVIPGSLTVIEKKSHDPKKPFDSPVKKLEIPVKLVPALEVMGQIKPLPITEIKKESFFEEDIYEFKEPEPFEPGEMRSRKESRPTRSAGSNSGDDVELDSKNKKQTKNWKEDSLDSEDPDEPSPKKPCSINPSETSPIKMEPWEVDMKSELKESTPTKAEAKKEVRDYSRKVDSKESTSKEDRKKEAGKRNDKKQSVLETRMTLDADLSEPQPQIEIREGQVGALSKDSESNSEMPSESDLFGVSVMLSPKKVPLKKDEPCSLKPDVNSPIKAIIPPEAGPSPNKDIAKTLSSFPIQSKQKPQTPQSLDKVLPGQVLPKLASQSGHILPQMIMPPVDSRTLAKPIPKLTPDSKGEKMASSSLGPSKGEERESKMMPFSQRQQHIFPHLLNRSEPIEDKKSKEIPAPKSPILTVPAAPQSIAIPHSPEIASPIKHFEMDRSKCESSVEESIEAVVLRARQDQMESNNDKLPTEHKSLEKRRRNPNRSKKILTREFLSKSSEDSDSDSKSDKSEPYVRQRRIKGGGGFKSSTSKRTSKLISLGEKKMSICDEEERANDADGEDSETGSAPLQSLCREALRRRRDADSNRDDDNESDKEKRSMKKKRRSSASFKRADDTEETGLGDLLCKETIPPGSPMLQESHDANPEPSGMKQEMPFASVPTGSCFNKRPAPPVTSQNLLHSHASTATPIQFPPSICIQPLPQGRTHFENTVPQVSPPTVTITSIPVGSRVPPISTADKISPNSIPFEKSCATSKAPGHFDASSVSKSAPPPPCIEVPNEGASNINISTKAHTSAQSLQCDQNLPHEKTSFNTLVKATLADATSSGAAKVRSEDPPLPHHPPPPAAGAILAIDNTPPTTPESMVSNSSDSPRRDNEGSKLYEASKSGQSFSSEIDFDNKMDNSSDSTNTMDSNSSAAKSLKRSLMPVAHNLSCVTGVGATSNHSHSEGWDTEDGTGTPHSHSKKRKILSKVRPNGDDEEEMPKGLCGTLVPSLHRRRHRHSSDKAGEEEIDNHGLNALSLAACVSDRSRQNFCEDIDPAINATSRIAILQGRMQDLKRTYLQVKSELASVERRRKKLKKKENEVH